MASAANQFRGSNEGEILLYRRRGHLHPQPDHAIRSAAAAPAAFLSNALQVRPLPHLQNIPRDVGLDMNVEFTGPSAAAFVIQFQTITHILWRVLAGYGNWEKLRCQVPHI